MSKVSIIGAGFVGSTIAHWAMVSGGCQEVVLPMSSRAWPRAKCWT